MKTLEDEWYIVRNTYKVYCFWRDIIIYCVSTIYKPTVSDYSNRIDCYTICVLPIVFFHTQIAIFTFLYWTPGKYPTHQEPLLYTLVQYLAISRQFWPQWSQSSSIHYCTGVILQNSWEWLRLPSEEFVICAYNCLLREDTEKAWSHIVLHSTTDFS